MDRYWLTLPNGATTIHRFPFPLQAKNDGEEGDGDEEFDFQIVKCRFPPQTDDEKSTIMWYLHHEGTETWSFASLNLHSVDLRFFRTEKGYIGVAHPNAAPGDQVVILPGSPVPITLREFPEGHVFIGQRSANTPTARRNVTWNKRLT